MKRTEYYFSLFIGIIFIVWMIYLLISPTIVSNDEISKHVDSLEVRVKILEAKVQHDTITINVKNTITLQNEK